MSKALFNIAVADVVVLAVLKWLHIVAIHDWYDAVAAFVLLWIVGIVTYVKAADPGK